jgi:hypothetical protein
MGKAAPVLHCDVLFSSYPTPFFHIFIPKLRWFFLCKHLLLLVNERFLHLHSSIDARYNGVYHLNPAKAVLMYFPIFFGREEMKKVDVN